MTEIAERPAAADAGGAELAHINHWINGQTGGGNIGPPRAGLRPGFRAAEQVGRFRVRRRGRRGRSSGRRSLSRVARRRPCRGGQRSCSASATWSISIARRSRRS